MTTLGLAALADALGGVAGSLAGVALLPLVQQVAGDIAGQRDAALAELDTTTDDEGLFGPGSMTWVIHGDPASAVGGLRALLLQAMHPEAMDGFTAVSNFRDDTWGRLFRTGAYVATMAFGTRDEAARMGQHVQRVHAKLGVDRPDLLRWVHVTLVDSYVGVYQRAGGELTEEQIDQYWSEQTRAAELVGLDRFDVPATAAEGREYLWGMRAVLEATPQARDAVRFILAPPMPNQVALLTPAIPAWAALAALAFETLPSWARHDLAGTRLAPVLAALERVPLHEYRTTLALRGVASAFRALPQELRIGPVMLAAYRRLGLADPQ